jgi:hypothetical protein
VSPKYLFSSFKCFVFLFFYIIVNVQDCFLKNQEAVQESSIQKDPGKLSAYFVNGSF